MSLDDREHVEAVAIIHRLAEDPNDAEARTAGMAWLVENYPSSEVHRSALQQARDRPGDA